MSINLKNYEEWFLDYHDGNLDQKQEELLFEFLELNPHLFEEFYAFDNSIKLNTGQEFFIDKEKLKAPFKQDFDELLIAFMENELGPQDHLKTISLLKNNKNLSDQLSIYKKTLLKPDLNITFPAKEKLKKAKGKIIQLFYYSTAAAAAAITLLFILNQTVFFDSDSPANLNQTIVSDTILKSIKPDLQKDMLESLSDEIQENEFKIPAKKPVNPSDFDVSISHFEKIPLVKTDVLKLTLKKSEPDFAFNDSDPENILLHSSYTMANENIDEMLKSEKDEYSNPKEHFIQNVLNVFYHRKEKQAADIIRDLASLGFDNISNVSGDNFKISTIKNLETETSTFSIVAGRFKFSRSVTK